MMRSRYTCARAALFAVACLQPAVGAERQDHTVLSRVMATVDNRTFQLDVFKTTQELLLPSGRRRGQQIPSRPAALDVNEILISCVSGCADFAPFKDETLDTPLGGVRLSDRWSRFITVWAGATGYWVRIYSFDEHHAKKVFQAASKSEPQFIMGHKGEEVIILDYLPLNYKEKNQSSKGIAWRWNGNRYELDSAVTYDSH